jgi:hypothetical protein
MFRNGQLAGWDVCVLCAGKESQVQALFREIGFPLEIPVAVVEHASLRGRYHVSGTPTLAIVEEEGRVVDVVAGEVEPYLSIMARRSTFRVMI